MSANFDIDALLGRAQFARELLDRFVSQYQMWLNDTADEIVETNTIALRNPTCNIVLYARETATKMQKLADTSIWSNSLGALMLLISPDAPRAITLAASGKAGLEMLSYNGTGWRGNEVAFQIVRLDLETAYYAAIARNAVKQQQAVDTQIAEIKTLLAKNTPQFEITAVDAITDPNKPSGSNGGSSAN